MWYKVSQEYIYGYFYFTYSHVRLVDELLFFHSTSPVCLFLLTDSIGSGHLETTNLFLCVVESA